MVRVKKSEDILKVSVSSRVDPAVRQEIEELAGARKWTISQYIEIALVEHLDRLHAGQAKRTKKTS